MSDASIKLAIEARFVGSNLSDLAGPAKLWLNGRSHQGVTSEAGLTYWAMQRADPTNIVYTGFSKTYQIPDGISQFLTPDHILAVASQNWFNNHPNKELYELLASNGAGPQLRRMETLRAATGSGTNSNYAYALLSVPGSGHPGIELFDYQKSVRSGDGRKVDSKSFSSRLLVAELVPINGKYTPVAS